MKSSNMNMIESNVMAGDTIIPPTSIRNTTATNQTPIDPDVLLRRLGFLDLMGMEVNPVHQEEEDRKQMRAEKRRNYKLRTMEVEQKEILFKEAQTRLAEDRRKFEAQEESPNDYTPGLPRTINDVFRAEKARNELLAREREHKEAMYNELMEKRAEELGEQWPPTEANPDKIRFDHIPKPWPRYKEIIAQAFPGHQTITPKESHV